MTTQPKAGELLVGAYLRIVAECSLVMYNQHSPIEGDQLEVDVIGVSSSEKRKQEVFVCEVSTHLGGLRYGSHHESLNRLRKKFNRDKKHITELFESADSYKFQLWSPVVRAGLEKRLPELDTEFEEREDMELEMVINEEYSERISELRDEASSTRKQHGELGFRILQVLEHLQ